MANGTGSTMTHHAALGKALREAGIDTMFGLMGDGNLFMVRSYVEDFGGSFVAAANEAGATVMARGYAIAANDIGVVTVTFPIRMSSASPAVSSSLR